MTLEELQDLREGSDFEAKLAGGRDGRGTLPESFWSTYSAFANTDGGLIALGVKEYPDHTLEVRGVAEPERLQRELWNALHNAKIISRNLLTNTHVTVIPVTDTSATVVLVRVPRARRQERPVYVGENPLTGTYRRNHEGDYRCSKEVVQRLLAEAQHDTLDDLPLPGYTLDDLDRDTLRAYRMEFAVRRPAHAWNSDSDERFLLRLGGWHLDRTTGTGCLTLAGLLMFGQYASIVQQTKHYQLDYQEHAVGPARWVDRVTPDASWSGNLFDFFRRVYPKLVAELKVPFQLIGDRRVDVTPVHEALREALVNTLVHADYGGSIPVRIIKSSSRFDFRNPGLLRISVVDVYRGGTSDCRNPRLQTMFQHIGAAEKAGTGFTKILQAWHEQSWLQPVLAEHATLEAVELQLRLDSFVPPLAVDELTARFGAAFAQLDPAARWVIVWAWHEGSVTNEFVSRYCELHTADATKLLGQLTKAGLLEQRLAGRWTSYSLAAGRVSSPQSSESLTQSGGSSPQSGESSPQSGESSPQSEEKWRQLRHIGAPVRGRKPRRQVVDAVILQLCLTEFLTGSQLADLLGRDIQNLRDFYLKRLVLAGLLELRNPAAPTSPNQAYRTSTGQLTLELP